MRQARQVTEAEAAPRMEEKASKGEKRQMAARMMREGRMEGGRVNSWLLAVTVEIRMVLITDSCVLFPSW